MTGFELRISSIKSASLHSNSKENQQQMLTKTMCKSIWFNLESLKKDLTD